MAAVDVEKQIKDWLGPNRSEAARADYGTHIVVVSHPDGQKQQFAVPAGK